MIKNFSLQLLNIKVSFKMFNIWSNILTCKFQKMVGWKVLNICYRNISFQKERQANHLWQDQPHREDSFRQINATWCTNLIFLGIFVPDLFDQTCVFLLTQCPLSGLVKASGSNGNHQGRYASLLCTFPSINEIAVLIQKVKVGNNF